MGRLNEIERVWISNEGYYVNVCENGETAYAYWHDKNGKITGDVWLYNISDAPNFKPWKKKYIYPPYLNPKEYILDNILKLPNIEKLDLRWVIIDAQPIAIISFSGYDIALLGPFDKPGRSRLVKKSGPLAVIW